MTKLFAFVALLGTAFVHGSAMADRLIGESGTIEIRQARPDQWHTVRSLSAYRNPVVITGPLSYEGRHPATLRVRKVSANQFQCKIQEWK